MTLGDNLDVFLFHLSWVVFLSLFVLSVFAWALGEVGWRVPSTNFVPFYTLYLGRKVGRLGR